MEQRENTNLTREDKAKAISFIIAALFVGYLFFTIGCSDEEENGYTKTDARLQSHTFVKEMLKSPSTAEFCYGDDQVTQINDTTFMVNSCVDSQNGFGAMIRSNYSCKITFDRSNNKAYCDNLTIE